MAKEPLTEQERIELELKQIELDERKQALESRRIQDELARIQLGEKKSELEMRKTNKERGKRDADEAIAKMREQQMRCNHHLGGDGDMAIIYGQGDMERPTAISGIKFTDEHILLRCNRCGKHWRSNVPQGNDSVVPIVGPWMEGASLFQKSQFKQIAVVGGLVVKPAAKVA